MSGQASIKTTKDLFSEGILNNQKVSIVNLGCVRNLVDAQVILGQVKEQGSEIVELENCDVAIINTCSFVEDAKRESIEGILELIDMKKQGKIKKLVVAGCLSERYDQDLQKEFPEIDAFVGVQELQKEGVPSSVMLTPQHFAYVKICESCYNHCSFCIIPRIKGKFTSRTIESILEEVKDLNGRGVEEINIVGQDITAYGLDLYKEKSLAKLLREIIPVADNVDWFRLLYTFPAHITDELIDVIAQEDKICKYIDIPLQHISERMLSAMKRGSTKQETIDLIRKLREKIPDVSIRTTFIVGFPGETDEDFQELMGFVEEMKFDKLGVFIYSQEENTEAFDLPDQVPEILKRERFDRLMQLQMDISRNVQEKFIGKTMDVLIDGEAERTENSDVAKGDAQHLYLARTEHDAPDVDGLVYLRSKEELIIGDIVKAKIIDALEYDLIGEYDESS